MMRVPCIALALLASLSVTSAASSQTTVPAAFGDAVRVLAAERHGIIAFHRAFVLDQRAPGHNEHQDVASGRVRLNDKIVGIVVYKHMSGGRTASPDDLAKENTGLAKKLPMNDTVLPLFADALAQYRFSVTTCVNCANGSTAVVFTSLVRDQDHADGTAIIDDHHRFERIDYRPSVLPKHATVASSTMTFGRVLPDLTDVTETRDHFEGRYLFLSGSLDVVTTESSYHRFSSMEAATKALQSGI